MELKIKQMNYDKASQISQWVYEEPYSIYSMDESDECIEELLNGNYLSVLDNGNNLIGYYCFGEAAQVPLETTLVFMIIKILLYWRCD